MFRTSSSLASSAGKSFHRAQHRILPPSRSFLWRFLSFSAISSADSASRQAASRNTTTQTTKDCSLELIRPHQLADESLLNMVPLFLRLGALVLLLLLELLLLVLLLKDGTNGPSMEPVRSTASERLLLLFLLALLFASQQICHCSP